MNYKRRPARRMRSRLIGVIGGMMTEPKGKSAVNKLQFSIHRNVHGFADAILLGDYTILHLQAGTERNEERVQEIVDRLNRKEIQNG